MAAAGATKAPLLGCYPTAWARRGWTRQLHLLMAPLLLRAPALRTTSPLPSSTALALLSWLAPKRMACPLTATAAGPVPLATLLHRLCGVGGIGGDQLSAGTLGEPRRPRSPLSRWRLAPLALPGRHGRPRRAAAAVTVTRRHLASARRTCWASTRRKGQPLLPTMLACLQPPPLLSVVARQPVGRRCHPMWGAQGLAALPERRWCQRPCPRPRRRRHPH